MARYRVTDKTGTRVDVTQEQYLQIVGDASTRAYVAKVYRGEMAVEDVPADLRDAVEGVVEARTEFSGEYALPSEEALKLIVEGEA